MLTKILSINFVCFSEKTYCLSNFQYSIHIFLPFQFHGTFHPHNFVNFLHTCSKFSTLVRKIHIFRVFKTRIVSKLPTCFKSFIVQNNSIILRSVLFFPPTQKEESSYIKLSTFKNYHLKTLMLQGTNFNACIKKVDKRSFLTYSRFHHLACTRMSGWISSLRFSIGSICYIENHLPCLCPHFQF